MEKKEVKFFEYITEIRVRKQNIQWELNSLDRTLDLFMDEFIKKAKLNSKTE